MSFNRKDQRAKRHLRLRQRVIGSVERPRMSICVTNKHMYVQFIDDAAGNTLAQASSLKETKANLEVAKPRRRPRRRRASRASSSTAAASSSRAAWRPSSKAPSRTAS